MSSAPNSKIKVVLFDFMGTCLDWHSSITSVLPQSISPETRSTFALEWRHSYFDANTARLAAGLAPEDIDLTHRRTLLALLESEKYADLKAAFTPTAQDTAIAAWHAQKAWPEVSSALQKLQTHGYEIYVHANGTTRLQLNLIRSSGLRFDMLFSSQLLGSYKPAAENYHRALELLKVGADECVTVAAHTSDLAGARAVGMRTVYVRRWTDDVNEDQEVIRGENDAYLEDMTRLDTVISGL
jgi:2-haloalkanoic acid dehalogenase type II